MQFKIYIAFHAIILISTLSLFSASAPADKSVIFPVDALNATATTVNTIPIAATAPLPLQLHEHLIYLFCFLLKLLLTKQWDSRVKKLVKLLVAAYSLS